MTYALIGNLAYLVACIIAIQSKDYHLRLMVLFFLPLVLFMNAIVLMDLAL